MKIALITVHRSNSFGACLQAYATYKTLLLMGYDVEVLDYISPNDPGQNAYLGHSSTSKIKKVINKVKNVLLRKKKNELLSFGDFYKQYKLSTRIDKTHLVFEKTYDVAISGSDQLWNPDIFENLDSFFFLEHVPAMKYISYASSCGSHIYNDYELAVIKKYLSKFSAISTREVFLKRQLELITDIEINNVCDPTFLIKRDNWLEISSLHKKNINKKYILLYLVGMPYKEYKRKYSKIVKYISKKKNLPVYCISSYSFITLKGCKKSLVGLTPFDFLNAVNNADLVLTSSYHGVAFSINFNKQFAVLTNSNPVRIEQLLNGLKINGRIIDPLNLESSNRVCDETIDYTEANNIIGKIRQQSLEWLKKNVESN